MTRELTILGIESSCDDTAAAVLCGIPGGAARILSSEVYGQTGLHADFGGVVPEIAARAHAEKLDVVVQVAMDAAGVTLRDLDAVAVTAGPGLIGGVMSGVMCAKGLSAALDLPIYGVNHLAGHALTPRLTDAVAYPYLTLLVSGGHCQFLLVEDAVRFTRLGGTIDDAPGEAFDKVARMLGLAQPGGPAVEKQALNGDKSRFRLPRPLLDRPDCNLSFSGLKTAVLRARDELVAAQGGLKHQDRADLCAGFQAAVRDVLVAKSERALAHVTGVSALCVAGGVAANGAIRDGLLALCARLGTAFVAPPLSLCTDNAAMIAFAALEQMPHRGPDDLGLTARPRWPLDTTAPGLVGGGRKGAKA